MSVERIVYITPGERDQNGLTAAARSQLKKVVSNVLEGNNKDKTKVFRTTKTTIHSLSKTLVFLRNKTKQIDYDTDENVYSNFIQDPTNIKEIVDSSHEWKVIVMGIEQKELKEILDSLKNNWYNVIDKSEINHWTNVYAVTIDPKHKDQSEFFVARWGK